MIRTNTIIVGACIGFASLAVSPAWAVNGVEITGFGTKAMGMGGVSLAFPQDAMVGASNPAGMAFVGHRLDIDAQLVFLSTEGSFLGSSHEGSGFAFIPEFGYNRPLNDQWSIGITNASAGGSTRYDDQLFTGGPDRTYALYLQNVILPTVTYKPTPDLAFGASLAVGVHGLEIENLPGAPNHGLEFAAGVGWRAGVMWRASESVTFGAIYGSKIGMGELSGYSDDILAAVGGEVDLPERWGLGVAVKLNDKLTLAGDYMRINWGDTQFQDLFGFRDQDIFRLGLAYQARPNLVLRSGISVAERHIGTDAVLQNALLTAVNPNAVSAGFTWTHENGGELSGGIEYDFGGRVRGTGPSAGSSIDTDFIVVSVGYGWKF